MGFIITVIIVVAVIIWYRHGHKFDVSNGFHPFTRVSEPVSPRYDLSQYTKKSYLFDTSSEFHFFTTLNEIIGADYYIFPQVNYSHLIQNKTGSFYEDRRYRSHIEKKSADFVVCDKKTCIPCLVIDLDGSIHNRPDRHEKDVEIDEILKAINLPILRLTNEESRDRELVKNKVLGMIK